MANSFTMEATFCGSTLEPRWDGMGTYLEWHENWYCGLWTGQKGMCQCYKLFSVATSFPKKICCRWAEICVKQSTNFTASVRARGRLMLSANATLNRAYIASSR